MVNKYPFNEQIKEKNKQTTDCHLPNKVPKHQAPTIFLLLFALDPSIVFCLVLFPILAFSVGAAVCSVNIPLLLPFVSD